MTLRHNLGIADEVGASTLADIIAYAISSQSGSASV